VDTQPSARVTFGVFELDVEIGELRKHGVKLKLQHQPWHVLMMLLEAPGHLVTREALRARLWPSDTFVDFERGLNRTVHRLREVLRDSAESPRFVETLPRRGYRFIAPVGTGTPGAGIARPAVAGPPESAAFRNPLVKNAAREAYLAGSFFRQKWTPDALARSTALLTEAVALAPEFVKAHGALAQTYCSTGILGCRPPGEVYVNAAAHAVTALQLDESLAVAHAALAEVKKAYDWDWVAAEEEYRRALSLDPEDPLTHVWYADLLSKMARHTEAVAAAQQARALDPASADRASFVGLTFYRARRYEESLDMCRRAIDLDAYYPPAHWFIGLVHQQRNEHDLAIAALQRAVRYSGNGAPYVALLGHAYGTAGDTHKAADIVRWLQRLSARRYVSPMDQAIAHLGANARDSVFSCLERACVQRTMRLQELTHPMFDSLRDDPRHEELRRRIGLVAQR
jgi:DNA-binding winged helix-turn-helix (wHTH) protein/Tfp pilus assembly protein PilF